MKKVLFLAICLLTLAGTVSAQGYYYGPRRVRRPPPRSRVRRFLQSEGWYNRWIKRFEHH